MRSKFVSIDHAFRRIMYYGVVLLILAVASCSDDDDKKAEEPKVQLVTNATVGDHLADSEGNTLYFFSRDAAGVNSCSGGCVDQWPVFYEANLTQDMLGEGLSLDDFGTITITGGQQTTYKGWPLYYHAPNVGGQFVREGPGEITGEGLGTVWYVAKADYTIMLVNAQLVGADGNNYTGDYEVGDAVVQYFTDGEGRTLYFFTNDKKDDNNFSNGDAAHDANWPVYAETLASVPSTLDENLFGTIEVFGSHQLTYKGWPVYYFGQDTERGNNKGVSIGGAGKWRVVIGGAEEAPED